MKTLIPFLFLFIFSISSLHGATIAPSVGPTDGGILITVTATGMDDFESQGAMSTVTVGSGSPATIDMWSMTSIIFVLPEGTGTSLQVTVTTQSGALIICSNTFSYFPPSISFATPLNGSTAGGYTMTLTGTNFGPAGVTASATIGGTPVGTVTHTHTTASFSVPAGVGANKQIIYSITAQSDTATSLFSYNPPSLASLMPGSGPTTGNTLVTASGNNFGPTGTMASVTVGGIPATEVTVLSHTSLTFKTPPGIGANKIVTITVGGQSNTPSATWSYQPPSVLTISPNTGPTTGGTLVSVTGTNFGPPGTMASVLVGGAMASNITVHDHDSLTFMTPQGTGINKNVSVTIAGQSSAAAFLWSYQPPTISSMMPNTGPTTGGTVTTITGSNFGPPGTMASVTIDGVAASNISVISHTSLTCTSPPGAGAGQNVTVTIEGQTSAPAPIWNYLSPIINGFMPISGPTAGGTMVFVSGSNFGPAGTTATAMISDSMATNVTVQSHSSLTFLSPQGIGVNKSVKVTIDGQMSNSMPGWNYNKPVLAMISPNTGPTEGGTMVTATGLNFGPAGTMASVTVGGNPASSITVVNHTTLTFVTPPGTGLMQEVIITIASQSNDPGATFNYQAPVIFNITPANGPTSGGNVVTVTGTNFGPAGTTPSVTVDTNSSSMVTYISQTALTFVAPPGSGAVNNVIVTIDNQPSNAVNYTYNAPTVSSLSPNSGPEAGGTLVTVMGNNFGPPGTPVTIIIDDAEAQNVMLLSNTLMTFNTPAGSGTDLPVQITIDGQVVTPAPTFSYIAPLPEGVGIGTVNPDASAALDISSTSRGILIPRMTTSERMGISSPAEGLLVYDSTLNAFYFYNGTEWKQLSFE